MRKLFIAAYQHLCHDVTVNQELDTYLVSKYLHMFSTHTRAMGSEAKFDNFVFYNCTDLLLSFRKKKFF